MRLFALLLLTLPCLLAQRGEESTLYIDSPAIKAGRVILWRDPGPVEARDMRYGAGGAENAPKSPFRFVKEDSSATSPKIVVTDADGREWSVKFGNEAKPDVFGSRMAWAVGYFAEANYFVKDGAIQGAKDLRKAKEFISPDGSFQGARFQARAKVPEYVKGVSWEWTDNPFLKTPQLAGLKVMMMLVSNWDNKDFRDAIDRGTNAAIYREGDLFEFFIDDWGASMGAWGNYMGRSKWNLADFQKQDDDFIRAVKKNEVQFGFSGQHPDLALNVTVADVQWLMQYLGRLTDEQIQTALRSSGATEQEVAGFGASLRKRIERLRQIAGTSGEASRTLLQ